MSNQKYPQVELSDNTPMGLVDSIAERIRAVVQHSWWYENEHGEEQHTPYVHAQFLPVRSASDIDRDISRDYPIIQVFHQGGKMGSLDNAELKIIILFGGWDNNKKRQGWRIPLAIMWAVLQDFLVNPFCGAYEFVPPIEWESPYDPEPPYWDAVLTTTWKCGSIMEETVDNGKHSVDDETIFLGKE